jgi:NitT/TauT family transport system substrate-binding protein
MISGSQALAVVIKIGSSPVVSSAGIYLAQERKYFKEQGLDVEIIDFNNSGAQMNVLLSKGELDVGAGNLTSGFFSAINQGQKLKIVADKGHIEKGRDYIALIVRGDHVASGRYKALKDLKGFKVGLTALNGVSQQILMERFLDKAGLKANDVEYVKLSYAEMNLALKSKNIDATIQLEPYLTKAELDGIAKKVASGSEVYPNQQSAAIFFSENFMEKRGEEAKKFMKAYLKGVRDYNRAFINGKERAGVIKDLKKQIKLEDEKVWSKMVPVGLDENGQINIESLLADVNWYMSKKYIEKAPTAENMIEMKFVNEAAKELSKERTGK